MKTKNVTIQHFGKSIDQSPLRLVVLLISLVLVCLVLSPVARGQDGTVGSPKNGNTAEGFMALNSLTTGLNNTAIGSGALFSDTDGRTNTAVGAGAMQSNTTGLRNTATGAFALSSNTTGLRNTATGHIALDANTTGFHNTGTGQNALSFNTTGNYNTAEGVCALCNQTTGNLNIALGVGAGENITTENNDIDIGNLGVAGDANTIRIGEPTAVTDPVFGETLPAHTATFIAGISGTAVTGSAVVVTSSGQLGVTPSSERFKTQIKPMDKTSEAILALQPVTFRYKKEVDPQGTPQFGLVAEEVAKVSQALVDRDAKGKVFTVRYEAVNAMLLNEFLKEHQKVQRLEAALAAINERLKVQDAKIDKVNAKVELTKPAPQTVLNQ